MGEHEPSGSSPGAQVGRSGIRAYVENRPVPRFSRITREVDFSSTTSRPAASLSAAWAPWSPARSCPGTVQDRSSVPDFVHSKTRERASSPCGLV